MTMLRRFGMVGFWLILSAACCIWFTGPFRAWADTAYINRDDLFSIFFLDSRNGWACGRWGTILHSTDGGKTWQPQQSGTKYTLGGIHFTDVKNGWAVGNMGTIIHTEDGGLTWVKQESPVAFYHMDVYFASPRKGWIASEQTHILATHNGGKTWEIQFSDEDYILKSLSFSDELHGWAVGEFGHIYRTVNGGGTWEKQGGGVRINDVGDLEGDPFLFDVVAQDTHKAWAVGIEGTVVKTEDGGSTWTGVDAGAPKTQLFGIAYDRATTLVIVGKGVSLVSENLGRTWRAGAFEPHIEYTWLYGVDAVGASQFATCGEEGRTYLGGPASFHRTR